MLSALVQVLPLEDSVILCHHSVPAWHSGGGSPECRQCPLLSLSLSTLSPTLFRLAWRYHSVFPFITAPTHFCSTAEHFCCASSWEDRKGFSLDVFCNILTKDIQNAMPETGNTLRVKVMHLGNTNINVFTVNISPVASFLLISRWHRASLNVGIFAVQHCRSRGWNTSVSIGTSALALLQIYQAGSHGWCQMVVHTHMSSTLGFSSGLF